jgi:N-methylhydantoinase B
VTQVGTVAGDPVDAVGLEILRSRLQAVAEEGAIAIERTAISTVITECRDYSCTLLDAAGALMVAGGAVTHHFGVCRYAVQVTLETHGDTIADGDVFFANDPYNGGGLHAQDVLVQMPVFADGDLVAWVVNSGHVMDMGGMVFGSWTPEATDCFQESLRLPPVRLFRAGVEQRDMWQVLRTNVRIPDIVEMDVRSLVAGCEVARNKLIDIARAAGPKRFVDGVNQLRRLAEREMRRRISQLADGTYRCATWTEWGEELYEVPCELTVAGDEMTFDFTGAPPQATHYFNTRPHIVTAGVVADPSDALTWDIPLNEGMFDPITVICPPGTIINSSPPAPVASAHCDVAMNASMTAEACVMLAIAASPDSEVRRLQTGPVAHTAMGIQTWAYMTPEGYPDGWMMLDGAMGGAAGSIDRDGTDMWTFMVTRKPIMEAIDVEMLEAFYPVLVDFKKIRKGTFGAGAYRGGGGCHMRFHPHGVPGITGQLIGIRERLPLNGWAGGGPGAVNTVIRYRADGSAEELPPKSANVPIAAGEGIEFGLPSGGGWGDPLDRDTGAVARDVRRRRLTATEAEQAYGVILAEGTVEEAATEACRVRIRRERLAAAAPAAFAVTGPARPGDLDEAPVVLFPGVERRGMTAVASESGAVLAHAPSPWTDGCPLIETPVAAGLAERTYLDPSSGRALMVEVVPSGAPCSIVTLPASWTGGAASAP